MCSFLSPEIQCIFPLNRCPSVFSKYPHAFPLVPKPQSGNPHLPHMKFFITHYIPRLDSGFPWPTQQALSAASDSFVRTYQTWNSHLGSCSVLTGKHFGVSALSSLPLALTTLSREDLIAWFVTAQEGTSLLISLLLCTGPGTHQELPGKMGQYDTVHVASN